MVLPKALSTTTNAVAGFRGASRHGRERPDGPLPPPCTPLHLNLLLVGRQGVGKTTFMLNACARWGMEPKDFPVHAFDNQSGAYLCLACGHPAKQV